MRALSENEVSCVNGGDIKVTGPGSFTASAGTTTLYPGGGWTLKTNDGWTASGGGGCWNIYTPSGSLYASWA